MTIFTLQDAAYNDEDGSRHADVDDTSSAQRCGCYSLLPVRCIRPLQWLISWDLKLTVLEKSENAC